MQNTFLAEVKPLATNRMSMRRKNRWIAAGVALGILMSLSPLRAQDTNPGDETDSTAIAGESQGPVEAPPVQNPPDDAPPVTEPSDDAPPVEPPEMPGFSVDLKTLIHEFQTNRDQYLAMIRELRQQINQAPEEDREALREQLRTKRQEFIQHQKDQSMAIRERLQELRQELASHRELISATRRENIAEARRRGGDADQ